MNSEQFVDILKLIVFESSVESVHTNLIEPPGRTPSKKNLKMSEWFKNLPDHDKEMVIEVVRESAGASVFGLLCVLDGVRAIEDDDKGELKLYYEKRGKKVLLNDTDSGEYLHDIFNSE